MFFRYRGNPIQISHCLQPEWSKYVTIVRHNQTGPAVSYDVLYDQLVQFEPHANSQEDKLTTAMMLLTRAISQKFSTPTNNRLRIFSNTRNQAVVQDGRVDIQTKNASYGGNDNKNVGRNRTQMFNAGDESNQIIQRVPRTKCTPGKAIVQCYNYNEKGHYDCEC
ncbi:hypothetical protein Tco_0585439 [Tanacetum coccineum]